VPHNDVTVQMNGGECATDDGNDDDDDNDDNDDDNDGLGDDKPKGILKRQQRRQNAAGGGVACDNGIEVRISSTESTPVDCRRASWSVADRVKQVEAVGFSTRVNFTEGGETTAVGFDHPADPKSAHRYSYNGTASPVWYRNNGSPSAAGTVATAVYGIKR